MDPPKLEWMYRNSSEVVDKEEYLLGRPVDKAFEQTTLGNEIEKDCLPTPVLSNTLSNIQVDVARKLKEDPLEIIRQQEIERRKQLLKNPVKLKKLQNMLKEKEEKTIKKKKKSRKKRASSESRSDTSDENTKEIDNLLTKKYTSLMKKYGIKSLSDLADLKVEKKKKKKKHKRSKGSDSQSENELEDEREKSKKKEKRKYESSSSSDSEHEDRSRHRKKYHEVSYDNRDHSKKGQSKDKRRHKSRSPSPHSTKLPSKDSFAKSSSHINKEKERYEESKNRGLRNEAKRKEETSARKQGLSEEEKQKRLQEMIENAKWRDEVREKNVSRYRKEEAAENKKAEYHEDFLRKQMAIATSHGSVEARIKSNINNIQRSKFSMNENFARR